MKFTLVYQGDLPPTGNPETKWRIRRQLEPQLRGLWNSSQMDGVRKYLDRGNPANGGLYLGIPKEGIEFFPLICERMSLRAELDVLLLSSELPGGMLHAGDLDNRFKTLLDALSIPGNAQQFPEGADTEDDKQLFCLLEDDRLVTRLDIRNDRLLGLASGDRTTLVVIRVQPVAFEVGMHNLSIAT